MKAKEYFGFYSPKETWATDITKHNRLVAHKIYVSKIMHPTWKDTKKGFIPGGKLEQVCILDIGQIVQELKKADSIPGRKLEQVYISPYLPDGTYVAGNPMKEKTCNSEKNDLFNNYVDLSLDRSLAYGFSYNFFIKKNPVNPTNPLTFCIQKYVNIDGTITDSSEFELLTPLFESGIREKKFKTWGKIKRKSRPSEIEHFM